MFTWLKEDFHNSDLIKNNLKLGFLLTTDFILYYPHFILPPEQIFFAQFYYFNKDR